MQIFSSSNYIECRAGEPGNTQQNRARVQRVQGLDRQVERTATLTLASCAYCCYSWCCSAAVVAAAATVGAVAAAVLLTLLLSPPRLLLPLTFFSLGEVTQTVRIHK